MSELRTQIIGIAGGSCSGKTTLVKELEARLGSEAAFLSFDEYFVGTATLQGVEIDDWESPELYKYDDFIRDLSALKSGKEITVKNESRESSKLGADERIIEPKPLIIIEGFLIFWNKTARALFDKRIFIELPEDEIIKRRLARSEGTSRWNDPNYIQNKLIPGHRKYVEPQREYADLVLDGQQPSQQLAEQLVAYIRS